MMTPTLNHISVKYYLFWQHVEKEFVTRKTVLESQKAVIFTKGLQGELFVSIRKFLCSW